MDKRSIPMTDLQVSSICLGTMTFGTPVGETDGIDLVHHALDNGINFIDTANMYEGYSRSIGSAGGAAEEILGKAIANRRSEYIIATKLGMKVGQGVEDEGTSPEAIRKHLDLSLKRLATDYVDLYYLHKFDEDTPLIDIVGALQQAIEAGKIRHYGISNYSAQQTAQLLDVCDQNNLPRPVIHQPPLSLLSQGLLSDLLPLCAKEKIAVAPYEVLQGGLLTGKYRRDEPVPATARKADMDGWVWELTDELFDKLSSIQTQADEARLTMIQYAIRWVLDQPAVVSAIIGVKHAVQLDAAVAALSIT
jgi:L-glyceraldehyde 3-phosphate reductase